MSDATDRARKYLAIAATSLQAMEIIGQATRGLVSKGERATVDEILAVLGGVESVAAAVSSGLAGTATEEDIHTAMQQLLDSMATNNQTIDGEIAQKFPPSA